MLLRLSNKRALNLADIAEVQFCPGSEVQTFAHLTMVTGGNWRCPMTTGARDCEAKVLREALRARPQQFVEIEAGRYVNLDAILSVDFKPEPDNTTSHIKEFPALEACWRWTAHAQSRENAGMFLVTGEAALRLQNALTTFLGAAPDPFPMASPLAETAGVA